MKTLLLILWLSASIGCDPKAQAWCEARSACGAGDVSSCLEGLQSQAAEVDEAGGRCVDEYYAALDCYVSVEFTCDDNLTKLTAERCSVEQCRLGACASGDDGERDETDETDEPQPPRPPRCVGDRLQFAGTWILEATPRGDRCPAVAMSREIKITDTGDDYVITLVGSGMLMMTRFRPGHDVATLEAWITDTDPRMTFDVTATRSQMPDGSSVAEIVGTGYGTAGTCDEYVDITGHVRPSVQ